MRTIDFFRVPVYPRSQANKGLQKCNRISEPFYQWPRLVHVLNFEDRVRNTGFDLTRIMAKFSFFISWESHQNMLCCCKNTKDTLHDYTDTESVLWLFLVCRLTFCGSIPSLMNSNKKLIASHGGRSHTSQGHRDCPISFE